MQNDIVYGVEKIEFGTPGTGGSPATSWTTFVNIEEGSVSLTSNQDSKTNIIPEDKDVPIIVLYQAGDPDVFNFGLLEISPENLAALFNVAYDDTTSTATMGAVRKHANLSIRLTTRPQFGVKKVFTYPNCICEASYKNNFTKNALVSIAVSASILAYTLPDGVSFAAYTVQKVNADGTNISTDTDAFDTTLDFTSAAVQTAESITGTISATSTHIKLKFNAIDSPGGTPLNMVIKIASVAKMSVDFPSDYAGSAFQYIDVSDVEHNGIFASGDVTLT